MGELFQPTHLLIFMIIFMFSPSDRRSSILDDMQEGRVFALVFAADHGSVGESGWLVCACLFQLEAGTRHQGSVAAAPTHPPSIPPPQG
jgi:hypothetical protein